ncbi:MAG: hypothetical protein GTN84_18530 [Hydrogenophaga sp.]|uniref:hypothetical protein n=1 Tax=Hydrogenophaga sp. TaxID=1904254 RepID=UPI0016A339BE|nr:hypothetical protein [Hydrogenophaga sp.]NIM43241.1 hypothetical protein [Hydrogenophaga sp.]NIN28309.1 hypothetical protein [Hydrogenophaga sp.]NIN29128.1 hypothetical protein [Hydrogenophaga sp.]NIN57444.1 hypothetical protein [Hydrogenophaga sp.]NIO53739.1 hypothetical protein [Hydrogenophaga sp.]
MHSALFSALTAIVAYLATLLIAVVAAVSHPGAEPERHFLQAVAELSATASDLLPWP